MPDLNPRNLSQIKADNPKLGECLQDISRSINHGFSQVNASPVDYNAPPPPHTALQVTGGAGYFAGKIVTSSPAFRGQEHTVEVSEDPNFSDGTVHQIHLGPATSFYENLGPKNLHFRSYSQYPTSGASAPVYAKNISGASGAAPSIVGNGKGTGYGASPYLNSATVPKR